jgi:hypothetical protein
MLGHRVLELLAVLGLVDGFGLVAPIISTPNLASTPCLVQVQRAVQRGLAAHGGQQGVRALFLDDLATTCQVIGSM